MFYDRIMFSRLVQGDPPRDITLGDGLTVSAKVIGTVFVKTKIDTRIPKSLVLNDTIHVPSLHSNLVSCSARNRDGYDVNFVNVKCHISRQGEVICTGRLRDGLYVLSNVAFGESAMIASENRDGERLWHQRFGHANVETLKVMARNENVRGLDFKAKPEQGVDRVPCTLRKQFRVSLKQRSKKSFAAGDVFYTDVCGPLPVKSIGGNKYFVTFTDAMSSYKMVRVMKSKSDVLREFLSVQRQFERKYDCKVKLLYSDNGGEYVSLQENLDKHGIEWEYSAPYTPQQNGVSERLHRALLETARTILKHSGLHDRFWGEEVSTAA